MEYGRLNPWMHRVCCYEKAIRTDWLCAYDCRCLFVLSGGITVETEKEKYKLSPNAFLFLPAGCSYKLKCEYARFVYLTFDLTDKASAENLPEPAAPEAFDAAAAHVDRDFGPFAAPLYLPDLASRRETFSEIRKLSLSVTKTTDARISALLKTVLLHAAETAEDDALPVRMVEELDAYIRDHAEEEISNTEIGAVFGYHPFYVSQMLKKKKGVTLHQYTLSYKLRSAADMLRYTDKNVAEIASGLGFSDPSYFTKSFKNTYGVTPKEFRKADGKDVL